MNNKTSLSHPLSPDLSVACPRINSEAGRVMLRSNCHQQQHTASAIIASKRSSLLSNDSREEEDDFTEEDLDEFQLQRMERQTAARLSGFWEDDDRLFGQLLDDLDNISANTPSARRRKKARDIFSSWLFSDDALGVNNGECSSGLGSTPEKLRKRSYDVLSSTPVGNRHPLVEGAGMKAAAVGGGKIQSEAKDTLVAPTNQGRMTRTRSAETNLLMAGGENFSKRQHQPTTTVAADPATQWRPKSFEYLSEDDSDSGYHTANSTLQRHNTVIRRSLPSETFVVEEKFPSLSRDETQRRIDGFNSNTCGLSMTLDDIGNTVQGSIRIYVNVFRPVQVVLPARPCDDGTMERSQTLPFNCKGTRQNTASFYLPKDSSKVIRIKSCTTVVEVIEIMLGMFGISDHSSKFTLYEKTRAKEENTIESVRRLDSAEKPLMICLLAWPVDDIDNKKFCLQENNDASSELMLDSFSLPELETFLRILRREEDEYVDQVRTRYRQLKVQMRQRLDTLERTRETDVYHTARQQLP